MRTICQPNACRLSRCRIPCSSSALVVRHSGGYPSCPGHARALPRAAPPQSTKGKQPLGTDVEQEEAEEFEEDGLEDLEEEEAEDVVTALGLGEDLSLPGISSGGTSWGEAGIKAAETVLKAPAMDGLELYLFRAMSPLKKLDIRLDKLTDVYGSPSIDDIEKFSRMLLLELENLLGAEASGEISLEVSSPGAERQLQLPRDLSRFQQLPLKVEYSGEDGAAATQILDLVAYDEVTGNTEWRVADVKANAPVKGRRLTKKQRETWVNIPVSRLTRVSIHVDF